LTRDNLGDVSIIWRPLERGPVETSGLFATSILLEWESSQRSSRLEVPNNELVSSVVRTEWLTVGQRLVGPGDQVVLARRELDEADSGVSETEDVDTNGSVKLGAGPQGDTDTVERGEVSTERGPLEVEVSPFL